MWTKQYRIGSDYSEKTKFLLEFLILQRLAVNNRCFRAKLGHSLVARFKVRDWPPVVTGYLIKLRAVRPFLTYSPAAGHVQRSSEDQNF